MNLPGGRGLTGRRLQLLQARRDEVGSPHGEALPSEEQRVAAVPGSQFEHVTRTGRTEHRSGVDSGRGGPLHREFMKL